MPNFIIRESLCWRGKRECFREDGNTYFAEGEITRTETYSALPEDEYKDVVYTFEEDSTN